MRQQPPAPAPSRIQEAQLRDQENEFVRKEAEESLLQEQLSEAKRQSEQEARDKEEQEKARQVRGARGFLQAPRSVRMGCKWKEAWRGQFPWINPVAGKPTKVRCSACEKELSCEKGVNDLKKHDQNVMHLK